MRFGAVPLVDVKMPCPVPFVNRSSQLGMIALLKLAYGRQTLLYWLLLVVNCILPFELTLAVLNTCPYSRTAKGRLIVVTPSSVWLPMSLVPGTIAAPVLWLTW